MTVTHDLLSILRNWAPESQAEPWDNVGLQLHTTRPISNVAIALEINLDTWPIMQSNAYDLIILHHPLIFQPLHHIGHSDWTHTVIRSLIQDDIGLYVSHTNLDRASDGVSYHLMNQYHLETTHVTDVTNGYGCVAHLSAPISMESLDAVPSVVNVVPDGLTVQRLAIWGGSGKAAIPHLIDQNIDAIITGELGYHDIQYLRQQKKGVILLGHYQSEVFILNEIRRRLHHLDIQLDIIQ